MLSTVSTSDASSDSRRAPAPTMPDAPSTMIFIKACSASHPQDVLEVRHALVGVLAHPGVRAQNLTATGGLDDAQRGFKGGQVVEEQLLHFVDAGDDGLWRKAAARGDAGTERLEVGLVQ